jgi:hypothetical protein
MAIWFEWLFTFQLSAALPPAKLVLPEVGNLIMIYQLFPKARLVTTTMDNSEESHAPFSIFFSAFNPVYKRLPDLCLLKFI